MGTEQQKTASEINYEDILSENGVTIVSEHPEFQSGNRSSFQIVGEKGDRQITAQGDSRESALKALLVQAKAM